MDEKSADHINPVIPGSFISTKRAYLQVLSHLFGLCGSGTKQVWSL